MKNNKSLAVLLITLPILGGCASGTATTTATTSSAASSSQASSTMASFFNAASNVVSGVSLITSAATGKGVIELAMDTVTGLDCRFDSIVREGRKFCEEPNSAATEGDFHGLVGIVQDYQDSRERVLLNALTGVQEENKEYLLSGMDLRPVGAEDYFSSDIDVDRIDLTTDLLNYDANLAVADFGPAPVYDFRNN